MLEKKTRNLDRSLQMYMNTTIKCTPTNPLFITENQKMTFPIGDFHILAFFLDQKKLKTYSSYFAFYILNGYIS